MTKSGDQDGDPTSRQNFGRARSEEATYVPAHGVGRLIPPPKHGEPSRNPGGRPKSLKEVRQLARKQSMDALLALIACYKTPDGKIARNVDGRVVVVATQAVLKWAYGEPGNYDPASEKPELRIDLSNMSLQERRALLATMGKISTIAEDSLEDDGPDFDASRFADEPLTIEAAPEKPSHEMAPAPAKPARIKPGPKPKRGRPKKV